MNIGRRLFHNIGILLLAGVFSLALIFVIKNPSLLQASVLNLSELTLIETNNWDIAYKQSTGLLDIFFAKSLQKQPITLIISHDPSISLLLDKATGQSAFTVIDSNQEFTILSLNNATINYEETALLLPFSGNNQNILIEEAYYMSDQNKINLSIGNISLKETHSN